MSSGASADDYPEHLNPFKSQRGGIRSSFREFKKKLGKVWRKKDTKEREKNDDIKGANIRSQDVKDVTLRNKTRIEHPKTDIYPRSRFSERVGHIDTGHTHTIPPGFKIDTFNPFEEKIEENGGILTKADEIEVTSNGIKPKNEKITTDSNLGTNQRRRRKKRAPLPPGSLGNSLGVPDLHDSKWSINSYETDCSSYTNNSENEQDISVELENLKDLQQIATDIQKYCNDIDISQVDDDLNNIEETKAIKSSSAEDVNDDIKDVDIISTNGDIEVEAISKVSLATPEDDLEEDALINDALESIDCKEAQNNHDGDVQSISPENEGCDSTLIDSGVMSEDLNYIDGNANNCEINYNKETSIYINNNIDDNEKDANTDENDNKDSDEVELFEKLALSCERLDNESCEAITSSDHPVPKIRKHKLSRDALLNNLQE